MILRAVSAGEDLPVPTIMGSAAQDMMNAGRPGGDDVVESDPWGKKRFHGPGFARGGDEDLKMAAGMGVAGSVMAAASEVMTKAMLAVQAKVNVRTGTSKGNFADNLVGLPADTPSRALRSLSGRGPDGTTRVFYVLRGLDAQGKPGQPVRLVWRQTHGDIVSIASRSVYYVSDVDGNLLDVVEQGIRFQRRPAARLKNDDKALAERFRLEKRFWLGTDAAPWPRQVLVPGVRAG
ncbi:MAG: hypothetical protein HZB91_08940 [Elusimicrobia bacterium]|nr:hypothetical protein [Elusimicrobiota bacterium]